MISNYSKLLFQQNRLIYLHTLFFNPDTITFKRGANSNIQKIYQVNIFETVNQFDIYNEK